MIEATNKIELNHSERHGIQNWPSPQDYNESIQSPVFGFSDEELRLAESELNQIGLPRPASGNFASVYHLSNGECDWAVRCFLMPLEDQEERYHALSAKLEKLGAVYMTGFKFISHGIRVGNLWYPILKMEWVRGQTLLEYIEAHLQDAQILNALANSIKQTVLSLQSQSMAHGDLQHGNILIETDGQVRLVDYDGCYVPALQGKTSHELGHRNYQHPQRTAVDFNENMDNFSAWLIWISVRALAEDPMLWSKLDAGDECLLFRQQDLVNPEYSRAFHVLELHPNESIRVNARHLRSLLRLKPSDIPALSQPITEPQNLPLLKSIIKPCVAVDKQNPDRKTRTLEQDYRGRTSSTKICGIPISVTGISTFTNWLVDTASRLSSWVTPHNSRYILTCLLIVIPVVTICMVFRIDSRVTNNTSNSTLVHNLTECYELSNKATSKMFYKRLKPAIKDYQQCLQYLNTVENPNAAVSALIAETHRSIGVCKSQLEGVDYGGNDFYKASELFESLGRHRESLEAMRILTRLAYERQQYEVAFEAGLKALDKPLSIDYRFIERVTQCALKLPDDTKQLSILWDKLHETGTESQGAELSALTNEANRLDSEGSDEARRIYHIIIDLASSDPCFENVKMNASTGLSNDESRARPK